MRRNAPLLLCAAIPAAHVIASDWSVETDLATALGFDSNPFSLNSNFDSAFFTEFDAGQEYTLEIGKEAELELSLSGKTRVYESDASDASIWSIKPTINLSSPRYEWAGGRLDGDLDFAATYRDSTFTSRRTGEEATSGGTLVGDRYDNWTYTTALGLRNRIDRTWYFYWDTSYRFKNYTDDFISLGLDRLDYQQMATDFKVKYRATSRLSVIGEVEYYFRSYEDRRARDIAGNRIAGSELEFDNIFLSGEIEYELNDSWELTAGTSYEKRSDNASGYYDKTTNKAFFDIEYENKNDLEVSLGIQYVDRAFDNNAIDQSGLDEPTRSKEAWEYSLDIEYPIELFSGAETTLFAEIEAEFVDNSSTTLTYDRYQALVGIEVKF